LAEADIAHTPATEATEADSPNSSTLLPQMDEKMIVGSSTPSFVDASGYKFPPEDLRPGKLKLNKLKSEL
jgi:hypothetical protein